MSVPGELNLCVSHFIFERRKSSTSTTLAVVNVKVKPEQALALQENEVPRISKLSAHEGGKAVNPHTPAVSSPQKSSSYSGRLHLLRYRGADKFLARPD